MKPNSILIIASFAWLLVSFWNRNDLPGSIDYVPAIVEEPQQTRTSERAFDVQFNDVDYHVDPEYAYDITGNPGYLDAALEQLAIIEQYFLDPEFPGGILGLVLNLEEDSVGVAILGPDTEIKEGDQVTRTGTIASVPVGDGVVGRVLNAVGQPLDVEGPVPSTETRSIELKARPGDRGHGCQSAFGTKSGYLQRQRPNHNGNPCCTAARSRTRTKSCARRV